MSRVLVGTCSWTDASLVKDSDFYPPKVKSAEDRLQYYQSQFNVVEVDSSYYAMPSEITSRLWVERTEPDFIFDIKAFRLFTGHQTPTSALPTDIKGALPAQIVHQKANVYLKDIANELISEMWYRFKQAIAPLAESDKLGVVLFQFPPWFSFSHKQLDHILYCKTMLDGYDLAIEFRNNSWLSTANYAETINFLRRNELAYVCVDEPQGFKSSVPPVAEATAETALVRYHGRNTQMWENRRATANQRFNYRYNEDELNEWVPKIKYLAENAKQVHVLFNNHYRDKAISNAKQMKILLSD
ncbi:DUF72 domain-containing protein [Chloroflexota bacterium]